MLSRPCISARSPADCCTNYDASTFFVLPSFSQARSRMQCHEGRHLLNKEAISACSPWEDMHNSLPSERYRIRFSPRFTRKPCMKRQTTLIDIIDTYSLRPPLILPLHKLQSEPYSVLTSGLGLCEPPLQLSH